MAVGHQPTAVDGSNTQTSQRPAQEATQQKAQEVSAQTQEKAQQAVNQAREHAQQAKSKARDRLREQVDQRATQAGDQVAGQASDLRTVAQQLREQGKDRPAQLAEQAADRGERLGSYLKESDADRILRDVEDYARSNPWAVISGGITLGFAASRFMKASSADRYRQSAAKRPPHAMSQLPAGFGDAPSGPAGYPGTGARQPVDLRGGGPI
jgi:ElaB/YqjD/DUF883 family membrane-anchored ribosome-binding protein